MPYRKICEEENEKSAEEEERIFYVAMTRAREKLILCASAGRDEDGVNHLTGWFKLLSERTRLDVNAIFDPDEVQEGEIQIFDKSGVPYRILLKRYSEERFPRTSMRTEGKSDPAEKRAAPSHFPALALPSVAPISVVQALRRDEGGFSSMLRAQSDPIPFDESPVSGSEKGNWAHRILQIVDFHEPASKWADIVKQQALLLFHRTPDPSEVNEVVRLVGNFLNSALAQEARQSIRILREFPFLFELSGRLLRGKLDLAFQTSDGWTLVDYKSDRHPVTLAPERLREYELQLRVYALAWRAMTGLLPKKAALFFLDTAKIVTVSLDSVSLKRVEEAVQAN